MARVFRSFGAAILFIAFVLQFLVSISLPFLAALDIVRATIESGRTTVHENFLPISQLRLGVWAYCVDDAKGDRTCDHIGHGYSVGLEGPYNDQIVHIDSSWTAGLVVHPVATGAIFVAFLLSFSTHLTVMLISSLASFLAALITLVAFAIDIALFALTKHEVDDLVNVRANTEPGPGFWITFATFLLLLIAGCTVCVGRRRDRPAASTLKTTTATISEKRPFWRRWRRTAY